MKGARIQSSMFWLCVALVVKVALAVELVSSPAEFRSVNVTGYSPWLNLGDAACASVRAAAAECYAGANTEELVASGFSFDVPAGEIESIEARWEVSSFPVPLAGWRVARAAVRFNETVMIDVGGGNATLESSLAILIRVVGDWRNITLHLILASTNEDTNFLASCIELRAHSNWIEPLPPPPSVFRYEIILGALMAIAIAAICAHRFASRRHVITARNVIRGELAELSQPVYVIGPVEIGENMPELEDGFVKRAFFCRLGEREAVACALRDSSDHRRFRRLRAIHSSHLIGFFGVYDAGSAGFCTVWARYRIRLNDWRRGVDQCAEVSLAIVQAAACALAALQKEHFVHGAVSCRAMIVEDDGRVSLAGSGHARKHDVDAYEANDLPALRVLAPEVLFDGSVDLATDRWGFGALCWEACSDIDAIPFATLGASEFRAKLADLEWAPPEHAAESTWEIARRCLVRDPGDRPRMSVMRDALKAQSEALGEAPRDDDLRGLLRYP